MGYRPADWAIQITTSQRPAVVLPDHLVRIALLQVDLDPPVVRQNLCYLVERDMPLRMVRSQVLAVGAIPDD